MNFLLGVCSIFLLFLDIGSFLFINLFFLFPSFIIFFYFCCVCKHQINLTSVCFIRFRFFWFLNLLCCLLFQYILFFVFINNLIGNQLDNLKRTLFLIQSRLLLLTLINWVSGTKLIIIDNNSRWSLLHWAGIEINLLLVCFQLLLLKHCQSNNRSYRYFAFYKWLHYFQILSLHC